MPPFRRSFTHRAFLFASLLVASACAHGPQSTAPVLPIGRLAPEPPRQAYQTSDPNRLTIAVVGINDFHGHVMAKERKLADGRVIKSGGAPVLTSMLKILRDELKGNVLLVDAGDEWQGTLESNQVQGSIVMEYFERIGMNVATLGNHEFDFGLPNLQERVKSAPFPYVAANIFEKKSGKRVGPSLGWQNVYPSRILTVGGVRVGIIGYSTQETPSTTRYEVVAPYEFRNPSKLIEQEARALRKQGAQAVLVTSHAGSKCDHTDDLLDWSVWTADRQQGNCSEESETNQVFAKVAPGTLDGAVIGHTHQVVHHWIHGVPSIEDEAFNQHFNVLYLTFDRTSGKLVPSETRIEGLIPICSEVFERVHHCDVRRLPDGLSPGLEPATFHGRVIKPDPDVEAWLAPILQSTEKFRKEVLAVAEQPILHPPYSESMFGNLVADVLRERAHADFALVNERGIRTSLDAGPITADALYRALPFDNLLNVMHLTGKELKMLFRLATSGAHQIPSSSGLRVTIIPADRDAPKTDLNGDGKLSVWETNRLVSLQTVDGAPIDDHRIYTLATFDFLVNGGDDLSWFTAKIPKSHVSRAESAYCRDLVADYLRRAKVVNTREKPLMDPLHPRLILQK